MVGEKILRLPHADGFSQFHDTSFLMILKGWFVVGSSNCSVLWCCFDGNGVHERATACGVVG